MVKEKEKKKDILDEIVKCPECNSKHLVRDYRHGELVCEACGLVIDEKYVDTGPEWRGYNAEQIESKSRTGAPSTYTIHDKGLSTEISWKNKDSYGKSIPTRNKAQLYRLRKWQKRVKVGNSSERNLAQALQELDRIVSSLNVPKDVKENAAIIYRKAVKNKMIRGRSIEGMVAASVYAACRMIGIPRTLDEISAITRIKKKEIGRSYRNMCRVLKLNIYPTKSEDYIDRFVSKLQLSSDVKVRSLEILRKAEKADAFSGRGPTGVAAAAIYISAILSDERRTQREIADVAGVTEVTIRNRYKELVKRLNINLDVM